MKNPFELFDLTKPCEGDTASTSRIRHTLRLKLGSAAAGFGAAYLEGISTLGYAKDGSTSTVIEGVTTVRTGVGAAIMYRNANAAAKSLPPVEPAPLEVSGAAVVIEDAAPVPVNDTVPEVVEDSPWPTSN